MIAITVFANQTVSNNAIRAAQAAMRCIQQQIDTRVVNKGAYSSLLPDWPNLRAYSSQLCHVEVTEDLDPTLFERFNASFQRDGFEDKIAILIQHHSDPISKGVAQYIRWRISRLINVVSPFSIQGIMSEPIPPCLPIVDKLEVSYRIVDIATLMESKPTSSYESILPISGYLIPVKSLNHGDYLDLYGHGPNIDRVYIQHPMDISKSITVSFVDKDDGWLLCASQFNHVSYQNQSKALWLTQPEVDRFFGLFGSGDVVIASGDTPIDLFYEMLYRLYNGEG